MFAYCLNNPSRYSDPAGTYPGDGSDPLEQLIPALVEWFLNSDENETDKEGEPTINAKLKKTVQAMGRSINATLGVGLGLYISAFAYDLAGADVGVHYDLFRIEILDGEIWAGQYFHDGVDITMYHISTGFGRNAYQEVGSNQWIWSPTDTGYANTSIGGSLYVFAGGSASIGIDFWGLIVEIGKIWLG